ncbi:zinc finger protein 839 [Erethizon dorsatum]
MADAEPETKGGSEHGGGGGRAPTGQGGSAAHVAPLGPEQLWRVLEQVTRAQPPPPFVLQDAARRLRDAAHQAALQRAPGAEPPRLSRLLPPQQLEAICVRVTSGDTKGQEKPTPLLATIRPQTAGQSPLPGSRPGPVGLGVQPAAPQGSVPTKKVKAAPALNSQGTMPTPLTAFDLPVVSPAVSGLAHSSLSGSRAECAEKIKKSLKVKTRSGRISRPPKYKAKDYKFIKMEDLAAGRPSDSDDYSELSAGDEEEQQDPRALFTAASCALRPRAFRCQACDKAYIGQGGLARHWRLNPGHGRLRPAASPQKGHMEAGAEGLASPKPSTPAVPCQDGAEAAQSGPQCVEVEEVMVLEPESGSRSVGFQCGDAEGPAESGTAVNLQGGTAQPRPSTSRARLQELLQQCGPEDLVELALPRLAQVATLYEFLLAKAKDSGTVQLRFPAVYKEFEKLHGRVKAMCQERLCHTGPASLEPLEISDPQVAESLGITEFLRKTEAYPDRTAAWCHSPERAGQRLEEAGGWQGACEAVQQAPTAWRPQRAALSMGSPECPVAHGGGREIPGLCAPAPGEGFAPPASGTTPPPSEGSHGMTFSSGDANVSHVGWQLKASADSKIRHGSAGPAVLRGDSHGTALCAQLGEPEENVPDATATQGSLGVHSALSPVGDAAGGEPGSPGARPTAPLPKETLPVDVVPVGHACRTGPDRSPLTTGSRAGGLKLKQLLRGMEAHVGLGDLECVAAVGDAIAFEITSGCPVSPQGQEQIFIQTASGVLLSHAGSIVSQENIALVTGAGGPGLHIGAPEGVPLVGADTTLTVQAEPSQ